VLTSPLVTVIVPGWNVAAYAAEALASLREQTLDAWRAILIDDGSTDGTGAVFADAARRDARFALVTHSSQRGLGAARNTGLERVETPYVGFLDADDVMLPRALELLVGSLERSGSDIAVGQYARLRPVAGGYEPSPVQPWVEASTAPARAAVTLAEHPAVTGNIVAWSKVSRTALWDENHVRFPQGLYEDQAVTQLLYARARTIDTVDEPVVHWRVRADGTSITQREADPIVLAACLDALRDGLDVLRREGQAAAVRARTELILRMDVPRLQSLDLDTASRAAVDAFAAELRADGDAPL
jgi:glycosyltransferase involved in cell wall biosynthesis